MLKLKFFFLLLIAFMYSSANDSYNSIFSESNTAYENKEFNIAKDGYLQILDDGYFSKELFLNLGNSYYKMDSLAHAILYYEKGLKVAPGNENLIHNLKICNKLIKDKSSIKESSQIAYETLDNFLVELKREGSLTSLCKKDLKILECQKAI